MGFLQRSWNTGNLMVVAGIAVLGFTFAWPYITARRVARIETWAEEISQSLLSTAERMDLDVAGRDAAKSVLDAMENRTQAARLEQFSPPSRLDPGAYLEGKHYYYAILRPRTDEGAALAREVVAWPKSVLGPIGTAFYHSAAMAPSYTRNLRARYAGLKRVPRAGSAIPAEKLANAASHRGLDGEHWIKIPKRSDD